MRARRWVRLGRAVVQVLKGLAVVLWRFPRIDAAARRAAIRGWSNGLLRALGVSLVVDGVPPPGARLLAANHVSWLDIVVLHAACPEARFVSKADVRRWPLLGRLVDAGGTLYLQRERKRDALRVVHEAAAALAAGDVVAVFPEGTTSDGRGLLPFHANLLQAAIAAGAPVQPVVLRYADAGEPFSAAVEFVGDTTLAQSLWRIVQADSLVAHLSWLAPRSAAGGERRRLAADVCQDIGAALQAVRNARGHPMS